MLEEEDDRGRMWWRWVEIMVRRRMMIRIPWWTLDPEDDHDVSCVVWRRPNSEC